MDPYCIERENYMKNKRNIALLICCLAVLGMFSSNVILVKAAQCTHSAFLIGYDSVKETYTTQNGHYEVRGVIYQCPNCKYSYWENLYTVKTGEHVYEKIGIDNIYGYPIYSDYCSVCGRERGK